MDSTYSFGYWVRRRRRALDLTQSELAAKVGCASSMIRKIETDERRPSRHLAERLALYLRLADAERADFLQAARAVRAVDMLALATQPLAGPTAEPHRLDLPTPTTSLIGRAGEREAVRALLSRADRRLVTLLGVGGIGKTRLALQVAREMSAAFADGVWFVDLARVSDPALVPQAVLEALGLRGELPGTAPVARIASYLRSRAALLVLDNCEHLVAACALLAEALLQASEQLYILATSRETLGVAGEARFLVPPLSMPDDHAGLLGCDAVRLFGDRAALAMSDFRITPENVAAVADICRRLDGVPLAIELAAARVDVLTVEQIAERLTDMFALLTGGSRAVVPRQQTLRASMDWSYGLLTAPEQRVLRRAAVFVGGWTLDAAEQVVVDPAHAPPNDARVDRAAVLDILARLVHKSLVVVDRPAGQLPRYRLLAPIREYALEHLLAAGDEAPARDRHLAFYLAAVGDLRRRSPGWQEAWIGQMRAEIDNVRAAIDWAQEHALTDGLRLATALGRFAGRFGSIAEVAARLQRLFERAGTADRTGARAVAMSTASYLVACSDVHLARTMAEESLAIHRELGDRRGMVESLLPLSELVLWCDDDYAAGHALASESLALAQQLGDDDLLADARLKLGNVFGREHQQAWAYLEEALQLYRAQGNLTGMVDALESLQCRALQHGDLARARQYIAESRAIQARLGDPHPTGILMDFGMLALYEGEYGAAYAYLMECLAGCELNGDTILARWVRVQSGYVLLRAGQLEQAHATLAEAYRSFAAIGVQIGMIYALEGLASLAVQRGALEAAVRVFAWSNTARAAIHDPRPPIEQAGVDRDLATLRMHLDAAVFAAAWQQGCALSLAEAAALSDDHAG